MPQLGPIFAIGGAGLDPGCPELRLYRYLKERTGKPRPRASFLPTASGEAGDYVQGFHDRFGELGFETSWFSFFHPHTADLRDYFLSQDLIYVGGGNTKSMLALWREWGLDRILREASENGTILAGLSAGSICWFEQGTTDSIPGPLTALPCLGYLSGSFSPHYDSEPERRPTYHRMVATGEILAGFAAEDGVGLWFEAGRHIETVSCHPGGSAFRVTAQDGTAVEEALPVRLLA